MVGRYSLVVCYGRVVTRCFVFLIDIVEDRESLTAFQVTLCVGEDCLEMAHTW